MNGYGIASEELVNLVDTFQLQDMPLTGATFSYFGKGQVVA